MARPSKTGGKRTSAATTRKPSSAKVRTRPATTKRAIGSASRLKRSAASNDELKESREQQTATAEILKTMSQSTFDLQGVLDALVKSAVRLCDADTGIIRRREGDIYPVAATFGFTQEEREYFARYSLKADGSAVFGRAILERRSIHVPDLLADRNLNRDRIQDYATVINIRSGLGVPLLREGGPIGVFTLQRRKRRPFTQKQIELVETFANEAVIAIENSRLFNEVQAKTRDLEQSLQQQTATADVLKVISRSAFDLQPVLQTLVESAARLCGADNAFVYQRDASVFRLAATFGFASDYEDFMKQRPVQPGRGTLIGRTTLEANIVHIPDALNDPEYTWQESQARGGYRTMLGVPMLRDGLPIGVFAMTRSTVKPFTDKQIALLHTFADQAVIAIENLRLFNETKQALERQTATSDILRVIAGSPSDVQPVFEAILSRSLHLCEAAFGFLTTYDGERFAFAAQLGVPPALAEHFGAGMDQPRPGDSHWRLVNGEDLIHNLDQKDEEAYRAGNPLRRAVVDLGGARSALVVALRRSGSLRGSVTIYRKEVRPFSESQIALLRHFADQAVIAIENVRLFNETREALERQTATAEILKVIASSPSDVQPVFDAIVTSATRLIGGFFAGGDRFFGDTGHLGAFSSINPAGDEMLKASFPRPIADIPTFGRVQAGEVVGIADTEAAAEQLKALGRARGFRSVLNVPLNSHGTSIGLIVVSRTNPGPFTAHHVELLQAFADQAVIAIENVRLFNETREALERQNASADILRTIASTPGDAERALYQIAETSARLFGAPSATIHIAEGDGWAQTIRVGDTSKRIGEGVPEAQLKIGGRNMPGTIVAENRQVHVPDLDNVDPAIADWPGLPYAREGGTRSMSGAPLRCEGKAIGALIVYRDRLAPFTAEELAVQQTFADQAAIAIENARLINETKEALERQTATAEILKVIASSPSDVQPVFDAILDRALHLCEAAFGFLTIHEGERFEFAAQRNVPTELAQHFAAEMDQPRPGDAHWRLLAGEDLIHNLDQKDEDAYRAGNPLRRAVVDLGGARSALVVA